MGDPEIVIRDAVRDDLGRIFAIYNREVEGGISTFDVEPRLPGVDDGWLLDRRPYHPVLIAVGGDDVVGWASTGPWSPRGAYRRTAEVSVYVDAEARGAGMGARLLGALVERARDSAEVSVLLARIALPNPSSLAIHRALGFTTFGIQRRCGEKLGRILDVELMDLHLD